MYGFKNILIGIFVLIAFAIIVFILLFLHPTVGDSGLTLQVRFTDVDKINIGTRVTYAGLPVGEVVKIEAIPEARSERVNRFGDVYVYQLTLRVDSHVQIYNTDVIAIRTSGLLGERNIEINPTPLKPGEKLYPVNDRILYAESPASIEDTLKDFGAVSNKLKEVLADVDDIVKQLRDEKVVEKIARTAENIAEITGTLNQPMKWDSLLDNLWTLSERAKHSWNTVDHSLDNVYRLTERAHRTWDTIDHAMHNFDSLTARAHTSWTTLDEAFVNFRTFSSGMNLCLKGVDKNLQATFVNIREMTDYARQGQGNIGQLFMNDDLFLRVKSILFKGETIANDINRYGLLFHQNKQWQRTNAWRQNLLEKLCTPDRFTAYFRSEVDRISTSLSKVCSVLNESNCYPQDLLCHPNFVHTFSDLLKKVEGIEESLNIYNEQITSQ